ncbi:MAG: site-specific integrase [Oscillospiraceae bacterium]|nr:site-specific integrase [Oscillospiraceae bacterium]
MGRPPKAQPKHTSGMFEYKATIGHTFDGKPIRKSFYSSTSKAAAKAKAEEYIINSKVSEQTGAAFIAKDTNFESWAREWLVTFKKGNCKEHTYNYTYRTNVENYMIPFFGKARLTDIRQVDIQRYFNEHKHLAQTSLKRHKAILYSIFEEAIYNDLCIKNPVRNIKYVSEKPVVIKKTYNLETLQRACEFSKNHPKGLGVYIILNTGIRRGELLGLMWKDIDLDKGTLNVRRAIEPDTVGIPDDGELKTKCSYRTIPLDKDFCKHLKSIEIKKGFVLPGKTKWGYTSIDGFNKQYKNMMTEMSKTLGIEYLSPHELRHTFGTVLREKGVDLYTISRVLGHADSTVTETTYVHNDIEVLRERLNYK